MPVLYPRNAERTVAASDAAENRASYPAAFGFKRSQSTAFLHTVHR